MANGNVRNQKELKMGISTDPYFYGKNLSIRHENSVTDTLILACKISNGTDNKNRAPQ